MLTSICRTTNWGLKTREARCGTSSTIIGHIIKLTVKRLSLRNTYTGVFPIFLAQISFCMLRLTLNKLVQILIGYSQWMKLNFEAEWTDFNHHWHCLKPSCLEALEWQMRAAVLYYIYNRANLTLSLRLADMYWFFSIPVP